MSDAVSKWAEEKGIPMCAPTLSLGLVHSLLILFSRSFRGVMSQTIRAHRLCQKAYKIGGQAKQIPLMCAVFKAYMEEGRDIADINVLAELAESSGTMSKDDVSRFSRCGCVLPY